MKREMVVLNHPKPTVLRGWVGTALLLLLIAGAIYMCFYSSVICLAIDGCGPYHHTTSVADLDGDGDLDVLLSGLRHESETIFWAGSILWTNQGGGNFTPQGCGLRWRRPPRPGMWTETGTPTLSGWITGQPSSSTRVVSRVAIPATSGRDLRSLPKKTRTTGPLPARSCSVT